MCRTPCGWTTESSLSLGYECRITTNRSKWSEHADKKSKRGLGGRTQERKGQLSRRGWRDKRRVQLQLALRGGDGLEPRRTAGGRGSCVLQHGPQRRAREERNPSHARRVGRALHGGKGRRGLQDHHDQARD